MVHTLQRQTPQGQQSLTGSGPWQDLDPDFILCHQSWTKTAEALSTEKTMQLPLYEMTNESNTKTVREIKGSL